MYRRAMTTDDRFFSAADVARLAGVQRPVVSMWRRRFAHSVTPFPASVARKGDGGALLFDRQEVVSWLAATDRLPVDGRTWSAQQIARQVTDDFDSAFAHATLAALVLANVGVGLDQLAGFADGAAIADELDPDEQDVLPVLFSGRCAWGDAVRALVAADVPHTDVVDAIAAAMPVTSALAQFVAGAVEALPVSLTGTRDLGLAPSPQPGANRPTSVPGMPTEGGGVTVRSVGPAGCAWKVAHALLRNGVPVAAALPPGQVGQRFGCWLRAGGESSDGSPVAMADGSPSGCGPVELWDVVGVDDDTMAKQLGVLSDGAQPHNHRVVVGAASALCDAPAHVGVAAGQARLVREGVVTAAVRLLAGHVVHTSRVETGLWVLAAGQADMTASGAVEVPVWGHVRSQELVSHAGGVGVADDLGELLRQPHLDHSLRSVSDWRSTRRSSIAAGTSALAPRVPHVFTTSGVADMEQAAATLRAGVPSVSAYAVAVTETDQSAGKLVQLGALAAKKLLDVLPGVRVPVATLGPGERFEVWERSTLAGGRLRTIRGIDLPVSRETKAGDVVFVGGTRPEAVVDREGGRFVAYPCRIARLDPECQVTPQAVAVALAAATGSQAAWKSARVWQPRTVHWLQHQQTVAALADVAAQARVVAAAADIALTQCVTPPSPLAGGVVVENQEDSRSGTTVGGSPKKKGGADASS